MPTESEPLESYYASDSLRGLIRSGLILLIARRVRRHTHSSFKRLHVRNIVNYVNYVILIIIPAVFLDTFQRVRSVVTGKPRRHPSGSWQYYLQTGLREDAAHHTNETVGYHKARSAQATELDDLTAWVMAVIQFLWNYEELMGIVWDEWTMLRLVDEAAAHAGLSDHPLFTRLQRQWETARPYTAPLNGTYADMRRIAFRDFSQPRVEGLPPTVQNTVLNQYAELAATERAEYQEQMSLLATLNPGRWMDVKRRVPLQDAKVGLIVNGCYYLIDVVDHDREGAPIVFGLDGQPWSLYLRDGIARSPEGDQLAVDGDVVYRLSDGSAVGHLDMAPAARVKWQLRQILGGTGDQGRGAHPGEADILLAQSPRKVQTRLRSLLPDDTRAAVNELGCAPVIINWDMQSRELSLSEVRRTRRGVGDHALTILRTDRSFIFDQSHIFFDGAWSLAMAEVLTNAALNWSARCINLTPAEAEPARLLTFQASPAFLHEAQSEGNSLEIAAETVIWDISNIFALRKLLLRTGTRLTVNDLLVITRIFHAAHYRPSQQIQEQIDALKQVRTRPARRAVAAIDRSLKRGRVTNPALLIPVDASPFDPRERVFPITFRNLADNLVQVWDDTWGTYQDYRRIEPADTPDGLAAFRAFAMRRTLLVSNLRAFSYILAANKTVAARGDSLNIAILKLLVGLPLWLQILLKEIPERFLPLNEIIRGDEVYSNVGRVSEGSTLARFMTAKDDGNTKALAWGVMSDDEGRLIVTMRDFRPHVEPLLEAGREDLARALAQDYVSSYTSALIGLVARLSAMLKAEDPQARETHGTILATEPTVRT